MEKRVIRLEQEDEILRELAGPKSDFAIISDKKSIEGEYWWKTVKTKLSYLVSLKNGSRKPINSDSAYIVYSFSPNGRYLVYYDPTKKSYFSYNLSTEKKTNISKAVPTLLSKDDETDSLPGLYPFPVGIAGWLPNDEALLVYDNYDIWLLDLLNIRLPINVTNGYGKKTKLNLGYFNIIIMGLCIHIKTHCY